jgi:hypothetical protein
MKKFLIITVLFYSVNNAEAQLTKKNWLVGGSGSFSLQIQERSTLNVKTTFLDLAPNIGYFVIDKLATGLKVTFQNTRIKNQNTITNNPTIAIGPFVRYYFLPKENRINLLSQVGYSYYDDLKTKSSINTFSASAGPVIYFNSTVGIEFTANYQHLRFNPSDGQVRNFFVAIGLQIHLEKEE